MLVVPATNGPSLNELMTVCSDLTPAAYWVRLATCFHNSKSDRVSPMKVGRPVVPDEVCTRTTSSLAWCRPKGGDSSWLFRSSSFRVNGSDVMSSISVMVPGSTPCSSNFSR